jgi:hypothetical protein
MLAFSPSIGDLAGTSSFSMNATTGCLTTFGSSSTLWGGMYDGRRAENIQTVTMDMGKLRYVLDNNVGTANFTSNTTMFWGNSTSSYNPTSQYNGIMYVEFPMNSPNITRLSNVTVGNNTYTGDQVLTSQDGWGLVIANGTSNATTYASSTPQYGVPNPTYNNSTLSSNATGRNPGFSLATNNALYVLGAFNADGKSTTPVSPNNPATTSDNLTYADPPACLAADSVTILSPNWKCITSGTDTTSSGGADTAAFDEVCAGFLTGIVPALTYSNITESGGAHNFPRFLENWSGVNFVYRGSIVALFKSEVASQPWGNSTYYSAPNRVWGFYSQFANGFFPPGTPNARYYMRVNFQYLTAAQYNAAIAGLP